MIIYTMDIVMQSFKLFVLLGVMLSGNYVFGAAQDSSLAVKEMADKYDDMLGAQCVQVYESLKANSSAIVATGEQASDWKWFYRAINGDLLNAFYKKSADLTSMQELESHKLKGGRLIFEFKSALESHVEFRAQWIKEESNGVKAWNSEAYINSMRVLRAFFYTTVPEILQSK